jgi:Fic family protein
MADNNQLLKAIESIKKDMATKQDIQRVEQNQARTNTALEALAAGQKELQETVATQADVQDLKAEVVKKIKQHDKRLDAVEEKEGFTNPYKN